ncbi:hypothetical protein ACTHHL_14570 [Aeribacillus composti]|uniref:hypothetical protein n=1 Tax=Aeribacillus composti TaxID=1868734 RepID=UPI00406A1CBC
MGTEDFVLSITNNGVVITDNVHRISFTTQNKRLLRALERRDINKINKEMNRIYQDLEFFNGTNNDYFYDKQIHDDINKLTPHSYDKDLREYTLGILKYLYILCKDDEPDYKKIEYLGTWLWDIGENPDILTTYLKTVSLIQKKFISKSEIQKQLNLYRGKPSTLLNKVERKVVLEVGRIIIIDFKLLGRGQKPDIGAIKVHVDFLYKVLRNKKLNSDELPYFIQLHVSTGNTLIGWDIATQPFDKKDMDKPIYIGIKSHDNLENEYEIVKSKYGFLSEESQRKIATALHQEKILNREKSSYLVSYSGLAMELLSVVEKELRTIINEIEQEEKKRMWRDIYTYLEQTPLIEDEQLWDNFLEDFKKMNSLRNKAAHGEEISVDDYNSVKDFVLESFVLEWISEFKAINNI